MSYLLNLRKWLRIHPYFATLFGLGVFVLSALAAIFLRFSYFYSSFVIGLFLFFDSMAHLIDRSLAFTSNLERVGKTFWMVVGIFIILTDLIGGQIVFTVWKYPPYHSWLNWILLYLIIYPVGGLSQIAMYRFFDLLFNMIFPGNFFKVGNLQPITKKILRIFFWTLPLVLIIPLSLYFSGVMGIIVASWWLYFFLFVFLFIEWTFFFDILIDAFGGRPILLDLIEGRRKTILAVVVSGILGASLHEIINTYVHEWVYLADKFPVTSATLLGVPVMVFVGWIPMTIVCAQAYRLATVIKDGNFVQTLRREYFS